MDFRIVCEKGIEYTNLNNFIDDFLDYDDKLTDENYKYLENLIWEAIEEKKGKIMGTPFWDIMFELIEDFIYTYKIDEETISYDLYKGWEVILYVIENPETKNHYAIARQVSRWGDSEFVDDFEEVYKTTEIKEVWKAVKE